MINFIVRKGVEKDLEFWRRNFQPPFQQLFPKYLNTGDLRMGTFFILKKDYTTGCF
ncbi:hypothetical protein TDIS_0299 [Thermosulfurimonas dismutans]|uniref:Uncharacterized protein n=1 Tax=Thermosulfurimonas dismutans TaxID=999894 RepID=A0A179D7M7_9BACT|nr:hypothetical protein TDIS_0299 [Thermosulfurimonas dismutans]